MAPPTRDAFASAGFLTIIRPSGSIRSMALRAKFFNPRSWCRSPVPRAPILSLTAPSLCSTMRRGRLAVIRSGRSSRAVLLFAGYLSSEFHRSFAERVERAQEGRGFEFDKGGCGGHHVAIDEDHVEAGAEQLGDEVQVVRLEFGPVPGGDAQRQRAKGGQSFRRRELAMAGAMD